VNPENSSKEEEEEEEDGGRAPLERWNRAPPSPKAAEAAEEQAPGAGEEAPATKRSTEEVECAAEASRSAASVEPLRKRKQGFTLR
jgi:hypothetical protein